MNIANIKIFGFNILMQLPLYDFLEIVTGTNFSSINR